VPTRHRSGTSRARSSAWHVDEQSVSERLKTLPDPLAVTASMRLSRYVRK